MIEHDRTITFIGRGIAIAVLLVFLWDIVTGGDLSSVSRIIIMAIAAIAYLGVFVKQCRISWQYEGAPLARPVAFRWVVAQWFGVTGLLIAWFLVVAIWRDVYNSTISAVMWGIFAQSTLYFFGRWLSLGKPEIAGPGQTGSDT